MNMHKQHASVTAKTNKQRRLAAKNTWVHLLSGTPLQVTQGSIILKKSLLLLLLLTSIFALLRCYAAWMDGWFFWHCLNLERGIDRLCRNISNHLPTHTAQHPRRDEVATAPRRQPEILHVGFSLAKNETLGTFR